MPLVQRPLPLLWLATALLVCLASSCQLASGQSTTETFEVTGYLNGADFFVNYSFVAMGEYDVEGGTGLFTTYLLSSVSGTRTFTNTTTGSSVASSLTLLPAYTFASNDNLLYPYTSTMVFEGHLLYDGDGLSFNLSTPSPIAGQSPDNTVINLYANLNDPTYTEEGLTGDTTGVEQNILDAFFTINASAPLTSSSSSSSGSSSPIDLVYIKVEGYLLGLDFQSNYSFEAAAVYSDGVDAYTTYTALYLVNGTRTYTNLTTRVSEVANLTLLPPNSLGGSDNQLFPYFVTATTNNALFDFNGLSFQLSSTEEVAGFSGLYSQTNVFWESTYYSEEGSHGNHEVSIQQCFTAIVDGTITGSNCAPLPTSSSSTGVMVFPISSSSSSSSGPAPVLSTIEVFGYLFGADYTITYSFDALAYHLDGSGDEAVYRFTSVTGTRVFTNTTTHVTQTAALTLLPVLTLGANNNNAYTGYVNTTVIDYTNSTAAPTLHALFDLSGVSFSLNPPQGVEGQVNVYWGGTSYLETYEVLGVYFGQAPLGGYFVANIIASPTSGSSSGLATAPTVSLSSSSATAPISVLGDPQFVGLRGQHFQVHGMDGEVYNLIVDRENSGSGSESESSSANGSTNDGAASGAGVMLVNARFRFLTSGRCPAISEPTNCWSHPGSYLGEVGVVSAAGSRLHVVSGDWSVGFSAVTLDGAPLLVGSAVSVNGLSVHVKSSYELSVSIGNFELTLDNSDRFINIAHVRVHHWSALSSHGLLGQTWRTPSKGRANSQLKCIEGDVDDYVEKSGDLFGSDLVYGVHAADE